MDCLSVRILRRRWNKPAESSLSRSILNSETKQKAPLQNTRATDRRNTFEANVHKPVAKKLKQKRVTVMASKPDTMTDEEFLAFIRRLTYYTFCYMNMKMYVGIDERCVADDKKRVFNNIRKAIRRTLFIEHGQITEDAIISHSVYAANHVKIIQLETTLESIDEMNAMPISA